ncbi:MAG TPA: hypothetical protein PLV06_02975 [Bacteroidales bacterium]|nr:hypothetical protein [Bacteroidales bacterium]HPF01805.1 hypothetical protein [Bacteroidales bacterium]HPJ59701.1 hypothetical protein [Bacteroidales bacterium]HPR11326.1 hypothetical protein [Bacteroidales bacterium]HRW86158.1 hypothetical protein [Bacteroidales bacterium]
MKKTVAILIMPLILAGFSGMTGCRQSAEKKEQKKIELKQVESLEQKIEENVYPLPTSAEVIKMLSELEVGYQFGISNPVENASKYITSTSRAINMGVFGADLSYCTIYNINQEVINYLNAIRTLANELNMSKIYDETLYDRIKDNFDNKDELVNLLTNAFNETYAYLSENDQQSLALLVVGGAWVEGMYLTCNVSEAAYQVAGISRNLLEQKKSFDLFIEVTKEYETDPAISDFLKKLEPVREVYKGLESSLTMQNIIDITNAINQVRAEIVK